MYLLFVSTNKQLDLLASKARKWRKLFPNDSSCHSLEPLCLCHAPQHKSGDSCLLDDQWPMKRLLLHVACVCVFVCLCASSCMTGNKSLPLAFGVHEWVSEPEWPEALSLEQCWDQSAELWQSMSGFPWPRQHIEAHTCTRWLQVDLPASNWTINAALSSLMEAVCLTDAMLPFGRRWPYLYFSITVEVMTLWKAMQNKKQDKLQSKSLMLHRDALSCAFGIYWKHFCHV